MTADAQAAFASYQAESLEAIAAASSEDALEAVRVEFQRVEYNIETTIEKIYAIPDLDNFLGDRLRDGR